jgi:predicted amidophosphoribosyltransferase
MLCRGCGNEMNVIEYCSDCNEAIHWRCTRCEKENDKSVHIHYMHEENNPQKHFQF